jgi:hypothetical protein
MIELVRQKRIRFAMNTKDHDGTSKKVELFYDVFKNFSKGKYDIDKILKKIDNDIELLSYFINEILIIKEKLEKINTDAIFSTLFEENTQFKRYIPVLRNGASVSKEKLTVKHLPIITKFLFELVIAKEMIIN